MVFGRFARILARVMIGVGAIAVGHGLFLPWPFVGTPELGEALKEFALTETMTQGAGLFLAGALMGLFAIRACSPTLSGKETG